MQTNLSQNPVVKGYIYLHGSHKSATEDVIVFKTNIESSKKVNDLSRILYGNTSIINWSIDIEDIDNVLRIETNGLITGNDIITLINKSGLYCEILND